MDNRITFAGNLVGGHSGTGIKDLEASGRIYADCCSGARHEQGSASVNVWAEFYHIIPCQELDAHGHVLVLAFPKS